MSFTTMRKIYRCAEGCGAQVSSRSKRCPSCHITHQGRQRSPEDRQRIARIGSAAALAARTMRAQSTYRTCPTSRFL